MYDVDSQSKSHDGASPLIRLALVVGVDAVVIVTAAAGRRLYLPQSYLSTVGASWRSGGIGWVHALAQGNRDKITRDDNAVKHQCLENGHVKKRVGFSV
jgi:hypothetical protein